MEPQNPPSQKNAASRKDEDEEEIQLDENGHIVCPEIDQIIQEMRDYVMTEGSVSRENIPMYLSRHPLEAMGELK